MNLVTEMVQSISQLVGESEWSGDKPFTINMVDKQRREDYIYELRKGVDFVKISEITTNNPAFKRYFLLRKNNGEWEYVDPFMEKYWESSFDMLRNAYGRLILALQTTKQTEKK